MVGTHKKDDAETRDVDITGLKGRRRGFGRRGYKRN